jgi:DNA polymerase III alpha subunit
MFERGKQGSLYDKAAIVRNELNAMSVFCRDHPLTPLRPVLARHGIVTAKDLRRIPSGRRVRVTGLLTLVHMPPTKSGKRVIFITMEDETGLIDVVAFPDSQKGYARALLTSEVQSIEGKLHRQGKNGISVSIVLNKVIPHLTGSLADMLVSTSG